jgi:hypothetical protein
MHIVGVGRIGEWREYPSTDNEDFVAVITPEEAPQDACTSGLEKKTKDDHEEVEIDLVDPRDLGGELIALDLDI